MGMYDRDWYRKPQRGGWWHNLHPVGKIMLVLLIGSIAALFVLNRMGTGRRAAEFHARYEQMVREQIAQAQLQGGTVHDAAQRGDIHRLVDILWADPSQAHAVLRPDAPDQPLHRAAWNDQVRTADMLLRYGADINARGSHGMTPLHYAARQGSTEVAEFLIKRGADLEARDDAGQTPANLAENPDTREVFRSRSARR
jgi:hypothetical protein